MKSRAYVICEGTLYAIIGIGTPLAAFFGGDQPLTTRAIVAVSISALVAGANAVKAFLSQSMTDNTQSPKP